MRKMKSIIVVLFLFGNIFCAVDRTWWKYTTLYEVYLPSFKDSNGDGIGDLKGLVSKLDHFVDLGIETVYITPYYSSPMEDAGYDVSDFISVAPQYGTMEDFEELVEEIKARGLKLVIDMVINHSSIEHPWFEKSVNREDPYTDYYVWRDAKAIKDGKPVPPNNWVSLFCGSSWEWNEKRKQFYLHQFAVHQPDLNFRNKFLKKEIKKIFKFWLDKGVSGFRLDATNHLFEDEHFRDEPVTSPNITVPYEVSDVEHIYTFYLPETYQYLHELRTFIDRATRKFTDHERILLPEAYGDGSNLVRYYGTPGYKIVHLPLNFALVTINRFENASYYHNIINDYLKILPEGATPTWNTENHDKYRKASVFNQEFEYIFTTIVMMLPGVAYVYYGQELGMIGSKIRDDQKIDTYPDDFTKETRDSYRLPMQWDDSINAGFSSNSKPYLPLSPEYWRINVKKQKAEENSHYYYFKKMLDLRKTNTLMHGDFKSYVVSTWVFAFTRTLKEHETYVVIMNLGSETEFVELKNSVSKLPDIMKVELASPNSGYKPGDHLSTILNIPEVSLLVLRPQATIILSSKLEGGENVAKTQAKS